MRIYGRSTVSEFLGDFIVYRNLMPMDKRLPALDELRKKVGLAPNTTPRKSQVEYARVIVEQLKHARGIELSDTQIQRLLYIGDTPLNDGTAFENICVVGNWPGLAFIGTDSNEPEQVETLTTPQGHRLFVANRWSALRDFERICLEWGLPIDGSTAVVIDLDKTALGARGRNDHVIDQARVRAVENTVSGLLASDYDPITFRSAYDTLNQLEYHPFTADNQDYLAYICLVVGSGMYPLDELLKDLENRKIATFLDFIEWVETRKRELSTALESMHADIYAAVQAGDPTPFKVFRREEFMMTVSRMGGTADDGPVEKLLQDEIVITAEVKALAMKCKERGALLFALSDKPDEASIPTPDLASQGFHPIHSTETHVVGAE